MKSNQECKFCSSSNSTRNKGKPADYVNGTLRSNPLFNSFSDHSLKTSVGRLAFIKLLLVAELHVASCDGITRICTQKVNQQMRIPHATTDDGRLGGPGRGAPQEAMHQLNMCKSAQAFGGGFDEDREYASHRW
jgi:hypothetical protein